MKGWEVLWLSHPTLPRKGTHLRSSTLTKTCWTTPGLDTYKRAKFDAFCKLLVETTLLCETLLSETLRAQSTIETSMDDGSIELVVDQRRAMGHQESLSL